MSAFTPTLPRCRPGVEQLESRDAPVGFAPTAIEQLFLERLNDARANPAAYGASIGLDLSSARSAQPLAFNTILIAASRLHSEDMATRGFFSHVTPDGRTARDRVRAAGLRRYKGPAESIAYGYSRSMFQFDPAFGFRIQSTSYSPTDALSGLIIDEGIPSLGHRRHLLSLDPAGRSDKLVGIGHAIDSFQAGYYTLNTVGMDVRKGQREESFITGCAFRDTNGNGLYDIGEGLGGVQIRFTRAGKSAGSQVTWDAGGYTHTVKEPGTYRVTASGAALGGSIMRVVRVGRENVRLNFIV